MKSPPPGGGGSCPGFFFFVGCPPECKSDSGEILQASIGIMMFGKETLIEVEANEIVAEAR